MTTQAGSTPKFGQCWGVEEGNRHTDTHSFPFPDTTDFQESFVTSGVFSVTELIQVSRSECPHPPGLGPGYGRGLFRGKGDGE